MTWKGIVGQGMTVPQFRAHVDALEFKTWRPSFMVIHNTAAPTLKQWHTVSGETRMRNLESYYKGQGWSAGPHAFVADDLIWPFTPFTVPGVHSPSWNGTALGIECVGDYAKEDDDSGPGLAMKKNAIAVFAILHAKLGIDPHTIKLHKQDPRTTHDCPGKDLADDHQNFIQSVLEYMGEGGEHPEVIPVLTAPKPATAAKMRGGTVNVASNDHLNMRASSSASSALVMALARGSAVNILSEAMNGATKWMRVEAIGFGKQGWVAAHFVDIKK